MQSHRADVLPMRRAKTLGMGLENIDEQLHSSSLQGLPNDLSRAIWESGKW